MILTLIAIAMNVASVVFNLSVGDPMNLFMAGVNCGWIMALLVELSFFDMSKKDSQ